MEFWNKWKRGQFFRRVFALLCLFFLVSYILIILTPGLLEVAPTNHERVLTSGNKLGELGFLMISMLPINLAFTIFAPSKEAIEHVLKLQSNSSLMNDKINDTFAILSRMMGFCTVPKHVSSDSVPLMEEVSLDSLSGFRIYVWKKSNGTLITNNIRPEKVDLRKDKCLVHGLLCKIRRSMPDTFYSQVCFRGTCLGRCFVQGVSHLHRGRCIYKSLEGIDRESLLGLALSSLPGDTINLGIDTPLQLNRKIDCLKVTLCHFSLITAGSGGLLAHAIAHIASSIKGYFIGNAVIDEK